MPVVGKAGRTNLYLGVDPGASGGLASVAAGLSCASVPMPATERDVWEWFREFKDEDQCTTQSGGRAETIYAVIERVHAFPGNGVVGMFRFGQSYGFLRACLVAADIPFEEVDARKWQKALGTLPRQSKTGESKVQFKNRLKALAQQLFPQQKITLATADALLLAEYCRRKHEGKL